ncbi:MAG: hypothetical protein ACFFCZ_10935 [Promethearchaeota archaeon]
MRLKISETNGDFRLQMSLQVTDFIKAFSLPIMLLVIFSPLALYQGGMTTLLVLWLAVGFTGILFFPLFYFFFLRRPPKLIIKPEKREILINPLYKRNRAVKISKDSQIYLEKVKIIPEFGGDELYGAGPESTWYLKVIEGEKETTIFKQDLYMDWLFKSKNRLIELTGAVSRLLESQIVYINKIVYKSTGGDSTKIKESKKPDIF